MTIQLIGKDDANFDDSEVLTGRWQSYIESYVSVRTHSSTNPQLLNLIYNLMQGENTETVPQSKVRRPYLQR
jgi:hypothetical protein